MGNRLSDRCFYFRLHPLNKVFLRYTDTKTTDASLQVSGIAGRRSVDGSRITGVMAGNYIQQEGAVPHIFGTRADLVQRRRVGHNAKPTHPPVGWFQTNNAAERGRQTNGTSRIRSQGRTGLVGRNGCRRPAG